MDPVYILIQIKWIPPKLVRNLMHLDRLGVRSRNAVLHSIRLKISMCCGGKDAIQPRLLILVSWCCESRPREFLGIEAVGRPLGRVRPDRQGAFDGLGSSKSISVECHSRFCRKTDS